VFAALFLQRSIARLKIASALLLLVTATSACTNYSAETQTINPPIIFTIQAEGTGHILTVAAQNAEIGFFGYRLYEAPTEAAVRALNPLNGTDCGALAVLPNQALQYVIEAKPGQIVVTPGTTDRVCSFPVQLTPGSFVALRALGFSITSVNTSVLSNAIVVP
jgi:hypothetical protein